MDDEEKAKRLCELTGLSGLTCVWFVKLFTQMRQIELEEEQESKRRHAREMTERNRR